MIFKLVKSRKFFTDFLKSFSHKYNTTIIKCSFTIEKKYLLIENIYYELKQFNKLDNIFTIHELNILEKFFTRYLEKVYYNLYTEDDKFGNISLNIENNKILCKIHVKNNTFSFLEHGSFTSNYRL